MQKNILALLLLFLISACAIVKSPSGGPEDKTPPAVLSCIPADGTKLFAGDRIELEFSEYVNKQSVFENLFITPEIKYDLKWHRKKMTVIFDEPLSPEYSYVLTLGSEIKDLRGNKPIASFTTVFSAGNKIDSGVIQGQVFDIKGENPLIFAYTLNDNIDTLNILEDKPNYKIPIGTGGEFTIKALKDGMYRVVAISDVFKDGAYDIDVDNYASSMNDVSVKNGKSEKVFMRSGFVCDTVTPKIIDVQADYMNLFQLQFSETLPREYYDKSFYTLIDSASKENIDIRDCYYFETATNALYFVPSSLLDTNKTYSMLVGEVKDSTGNILNRNDNAVSFSALSDKKEFAVKIRSTSHGDSTKAHIATEKMHFTFDYPIDTNTLNSAITLTKISSDTVAMPLLMDNLGSIDFEFYTAEELLAGEKYRIDINLGQIKSTEGVVGKDTTISYHFKTYAKNELSTIKGHIVGNIAFSKIILMLSSPKANYVVRANKDGFWSIDNVLAGSYVVDAYFDANGNMLYDYGKPQPYENSELFFKAVANIKVKKGWDTEDAVIKIGF